MSRLEARLARLEAEGAARCALRPFDSLATAARLISIYTGIGDPIAVPVLTAGGPPATPAARRAAEAARRVLRIQELLGAAVARQRFSDLA